jgi:tRNA (cytidine/uridine-2'-O-)-methyltransferase
MLNLVLYQPDIPQNLGAVLRLSACLGCAVHIVEPCGFPFDDQKLRRAGMDYIHKATYRRHLSWDAFLKYRETAPGRLLLLETDGATRYTDVAYRPSDYVMLGRESAGTPAALYPLMDATITIPMREGMRSLNVAMSAGMLVAEVARQQGWNFAHDSAAPLA